MCGLKESVQSPELLAVTSGRREIELRERAYLAGCVQGAEDLAGDFHEDDLVLDAGGEGVRRVEILLILLLAGLDDQQSLFLEVLCLRR